MKNKRNAAIDMDAAEFRKLGHELVDSISDFMENLSDKPVTTGKSPMEVRELLSSTTLPEDGTSPSEILERASETLFSHSLFNGHPKFLGYITSSPAPVGVLADFLASALNQNMGAQILSPVATEIEKTTVQWLCELVGVGPGWGGLLVSGGNMANLTGFLAGRRNKLPDEIQQQGLKAQPAESVVYCAKSTHTWIEKAMTLFGQGSNSLRWIETDSGNRMNLASLRSQIETDKSEGLFPMMVVGTAGDVSTGAVDDLEGIASLCEEFELWFHVDGAYGAPAAALPEIASLFQGMNRADSIALDPHKWLYSPLEAGCTLVKDPRSLLKTFSSRPDYYNFGVNAESSVNFYEYGMQNSRGFRALKVWMGLQHSGRSGYVKMIREDIELAEYLFQLADARKELVAMNCNLSITTFRYKPEEINVEGKKQKEWLNSLNEDLVNTLQGEGELFVSNAIIDGYYCLRACVVNFRTDKEDMEEIIDTVIRVGFRISQAKQLQEDE